MEFLSGDALGTGLGTAAAALINAKLPKPDDTEGIVARLPIPVAVAIAVAAYDLVHSRLHQLGHVWGPGWRVHSAHHSPKGLYWINAGRFHAAELLIDSPFGGLVIGRLGLSRDQHIACQTVRLTYGQLQHCNIDLRSGPLDHLFSTPDIHRWHHSTIYAEGNTNYGAITTIWDKLFGTFYRPADRDGPDELGVGRMPDFPQRCWELQRVPVDWARIRERNADTWFCSRRRTGPSGPSSTKQRD